jgi:hypothetical protein
MFGSLAEKVGKAQALELLGRPNIAMDSLEVQELRRMIRSLWTGPPIDTPTGQRLEDFFVLVLRRISATSEKWQQMSAEDRMNAVEKLTHPLTFIEAMEDLGMTEVEDLDLDGGWL